MVLVVFETGEDAAAACVVDYSRYQVFSGCVEVEGWIGSLLTR